MDDRNSAMLWHLMQNLSSSPQEEQVTEPPQFEQSLISLRPLMSPKQQRVIDLMIKLQEVKALLHEMQDFH